MFVIAAIGRPLSKLVSHFQYGIFVAVAFAVPLTVVWGAISYKLIERPILKTLYWQPKRLEKTQMDLEGKKPRIDAVAVNPIQDTAPSD